MSAAGPVEAAWRRYRAMVVSADAGEVQLRETQLAFYGGATLVYDAVMRLGAEEVSEDQAMLALERIGVELLALRAALLITVQAEATAAENSDS